MPLKLIQAVLRLRDSGRAIPRYQLAFTSQCHGVLLITEDHVAELNRRAVIATLRNSSTGAPVDGLPPLWDARIVRMTAEEYVLTGIEATSIGIQDAVVAQTWLVRFVEILTDEQG